MTGHEHGHSTALHGGTSGLTLLELLIAMAMTALLTTGSIFTLQALRSVDSDFNHLSEAHLTLLDLESSLRQDIDRARVTTDLEPFREITTGLDPDRAHEARDGFFNRSWDVFRAVDDPGTKMLRGRSRYLTRSYPVRTLLDESKGLIPPDPRTPYFETVVEGVNQPYGPVYDFLAGIVNCGLRDSFFFRSSRETESGIQPIAVCYRLVERSDVFNADLGRDGMADEFEPGYHPLYRRDPTLDNAPSRRTIVEGDGLLTGFEGRIGGSADRRPLVYELQRLVSSLQPGDRLGTLTPRVDVQILSRDIREFNVLYYDRGSMRYREPPGLIQRFGYPVDFGAAVVATGTRTFRVVGAVSPEIDPNGLLPRDTRHIFLYQLNLAWKPGDAPSTLFTVPPRIYTVGSLVSGRRGFTIVEAISATSGDPVHSVGGMGSVGYIDADGVLRSRGVTDGFKNLRPNGRIYLEQRPLANPAAPFARPDPILDPDESVYTIRPGLYRIVELRGQGVRIDLEGQRSKPGTPVVFRAGFLPPAVKIETTVDRGNGKVVRCAPLVIRMPQE